MATLPTPEEFVQRARALRPKLRERAEECERLRRMPDATVADFLDGEFLRIMQPKRLGGCEYGWDVWCECLIEFAKGCGSQAWATMVHCEYVQLLSACSQKVQEEVWGENPRALISSSFQPVGKVEKVDGGYTLATANPAARWGFSSGIDEAQWLIVGGIIPGRGWTFSVVPRSVATIIDDWYVMGLAGTGSKSFTIHGTFVPEYRTITDQELNDGRGPGVTPSSPAISRFPRKAGAGLGIAAVPVGVAIGMLEDYQQIERERFDKRPRGPADQGVALRIAECASDLDAAVGALLNTAKECMHILNKGEELSREQRMKSRRNAGYAAMLAQRVSERIYTAAGSAAVYKTSAIQRGFRDIHAGANHMGVSWEIAGSPYGEYMAGREPVIGQW